jgi:CelD/BcsL family acetyltransferase involved in cellulose biosynthesis
VEGLSLASDLAARGGEARSSVRCLTPSQVALTRMPLADALALGPATWDPLQARAESPSPFMSWAWHRAWADAVPAAELAASEAFVLGSPGTGVVGVLPVRLQRVSFHRVPVTALIWAIGDLGCPDHLDVLAAPQADLAALAPVLEEVPWQVLILSNLAPDAPNAGRLGEAIAAHGHVLRRRALWGCPYLELGDDWERYLATLTPTRRQTLRRKERNLRRHHAVAITDYGADRLDEGWGRLVALHQRRWQGAGAFQAPHVERLHRRFTAELAARGQLWLSTLDVDGDLAAAWYGFAYRDTVYFYQSGRDPRWERESVGLILMGAMIRRAMERGYRRFDFLRGEDGYKRHWTTTRRITEEITIFRRGWRGRWLQAVASAAGIRARLRATTGRGAAEGESADV